MTRTILLLCSLPFAFRLVLYILRLFRVRRFISAFPDRVQNHKNGRTVLLLLVPVLREQNIITQTIEHFCGMNLDCIDLRVMVVGTCREVRTSGFKTLEVVERWVGSVAGKLPSNVHIDYCEAIDEGGDRASQLNWAVRRASEVGWNDWDVVGVYDADSLPSRDSLVEAVNAFCTIPELDACQQPARFVSSANAMAGRSENPLLVANALYQDTWTAINELPMWIGYSSLSCAGRRSLRHLYFIGHGEFLSRNAYDKFRFPEGEVTDGIQLGYRLGLSGAVTIPLHVFCEDDVPHGVGVLIKQHKRWFGGCMNILSAYRASHGQCGVASALQVVDAFWSQIRWAWATLAFMVLCGFAFVHDGLVFAMLCVMIVLYCYVIPLVAHRVIRADMKVRGIDWLCVPIAVLVKAIGPNLYFFEKLIKKTIKYDKVER